MEPALVPFPEMCWTKNEIGLLRGLAMNHSAEEIRSHLREIIPEYDAQAGPAVL
jgi:hypothetical protein